MLDVFWRRMRRDQRGFTLIELLIVIAIIAILAAILIPNFLRARRQALVSATKGNLKNLGTALESYFVDRNAYPDDATLAVLAPDYIRAVPPKPGAAGGAYDYAFGGVGPSAYVLCDDTTDTVTDPGGATTLWYYAPNAGLGGVVAADVAINFGGSPAVIVTCPP